MSIKTMAVLIVACLAVLVVYLFQKGYDFSADKSPVLVDVSGCRITVDEFSEGFLASAFGARADKLQARREYLETLIDQKLILLDAEKKNMDKAPDFLRSVERFWSQSLLTVALGKKTVEFHQATTVRDEDVRRIYDGMVKDGVTTKSISEVYSQIKWQAEKQAESQQLNIWIAGLRQGASISIDEALLKAMK